MRVFLDTADIKAIEEFSEMGFIDGVTTNPTIIRKQGDISVDEFLKKVSGIVGCVSIQLASPSDDWNHYMNYQSDECDILIKIPFCKWGLEIMSTMPSNLVNLTGITSKGQAIMAASLKPKILSIFWNRILDVEAERIRNLPTDQRANKLFYTEDAIPAAAAVVQTALRTRWADSDGDPLTEVLVGSLRKAQDILDAADAGATTITAKPELWRELMQSTATTKILEEWYGTIA